MATRIALWTAKAIAWFIALSVALVLVLRFVPVTYTLTMLFDENAVTERSEKRGQFIHYSLVRESLVNTLNGFVQEVCPVARPIKRESEKRAQAAVPAIGDKT